MPDDMWANVHKVFSLHLASSAAVRDLLSSTKQHLLSAIKIRLDSRLDFPSARIKLFDFVRQLSFEASLKTLNGSDFYSEDMQSAFHAYDSDFPFLAVGAPAAVSFITHPI